MHKSKAVIFDIDGTLSDPTHRLHHLARNDWDSFYAELGKDGLKAATRELLYALQAHDWVHKIILVSGRPEEYREATKTWLDANHIFVDALLMRPSGDFRPDHVVKEEILRALETDHQILMAFDDRPTIVDMWRRNNVPVFVVPGFGETHPAPGKKAKLTIMVGPAGSGKSTFLSTVVNQAVYGFHPAHVVSSDQIRGDLCGGDFKDQSKNTEVFEALHAVVKMRLSHGLPTVIDATNIQRKARLENVALADDPSCVRYIVVDRPLSEKRRDGGWRNEIAGVDLIGKHDQTFRSQLKDILAGDGLGIQVVDVRTNKDAKTS